MPAPKLNALVEVFASQVQVLEDEVLNVFFGRLLDNAVGVQLDGLGDLVGEPRKTLDDDAYRNAIRVRIFQNQASGTPEEMLVLLRYLVPDVVGLHLLEVFPAKVKFSMTTGTQPADLQDLMQRAAPAGVGVRVLAIGEELFRMGDRMGERL